MTLPIRALLVVNRPAPGRSRPVRPAKNTAAAGCVAAAAANRLATQKLWCESIAAVRRGTPAARPSRGLDIRCSDEERSAQGSGQDTGDGQCVEAHGRASVLYHKVLRLQPLGCIGHPPGTGCLPGKGCRWTMPIFLTNRYKSISLYTNSVTSCYRTRDLLRLRGSVSCGAFDGGPADPDLGSGR